MAAHLPPPLTKSSHPSNRVWAKSWQMLCPAGNSRSRNLRMPGATWRCPAIDGGGRGQGHAGRSATAETEGPGGSTSSRMIVCAPRFFTPGIEVTCSTAVRKGADTGPHLRVDLGDGGVKHQSD